MNNTNSGKQNDVVKDVDGDFVKDVHGDFVKDSDGNFVKCVFHNFNNYITNPSSSSSTTSSSMVNTNSGKQDDVVKDVADDSVKQDDIVEHVAGDSVKQDDSGKQEDVVENVAGDSVKQDDSGKQDDVGKDVNKVARGVLIAGVLIAGVLIAVVLKLIHKLSYDGKVAVNASLSATADNNCSWLSPSGEFAFGFRHFENKDQFFLCIWFDKIRNRTIVWCANGDSHASERSTVKLTAESGLVLTSPQGEVLWKPYQTIDGVVAHGVMKDTGNFVLEDDKSESLWETFKNPTDTMLPGQRIERGGKLFSRQSETNYSRGRFQLDFQGDGNLVFRDENQKALCSTGTTIGNVTGSEGQQLVFDDSGFYILRNNNGKFKFTAEELPAGDNYFRLTLNFDGVLALYYLPKSSEGAPWTALWSEPHKVDSVAGDCWDNCSNCYLNVTPKHNCECKQV